MITAAEHRENFFPDYRGRTAGSIVEINTSQPSEKIGLSEGLSDGSQEEDSTFLDILKAAVDVINPLQHIPLVSTIYRSVSGDEINTPAKIAGDTVYGGIIGGLVSFATSALEYMSENSSETDNKDSDSSIKTPIKDQKDTNSVMNSYLDANLTDAEKSTFLFSIER